ncbi:MAG: ferrous iron transport protein B [Candidatus Binatia bacterium]
MSAPAKSPDSDAGSPRSAREQRRVVALAGNPNVGKTTVFNQLTGLRQKVANYPGVTVERKDGSFVAADGRHVDVVDVPGTYSLNPRSLDEEVAYRVLIGAIEGARRPDLVVCLVDASNLERNLYLASQVMDLGIPAIIALNMMDAATAEGLEVDVAGLAEELGVPVIPLVASKGQGIAELRAAMSGALPTAPPRRWTLDGPLAEHVDELAARLAVELPELGAEQRFSDALRALVNEGASFFETHHTPAFWCAVREARADLERAGVEYQRAEIVARYRWLADVSGRVVSRRHRRELTWSDSTDAVLTHRVAGPLIFFAVLGLIFQSVFAWAVPFMETIDGAVIAVGDLVTATMPAGPLRDLFVDGVIAGVGAVVIFLPQILILFFFLGLLEDTGYMARAAFIMDRVMRRIGLSGRSVVPMLSGFACAIPGIMAARTIENERDRLVTILVLPLMTCSARLPVYALLIAAFIPADRMFGLFGYQGLTLLVMYALGVLLAIAAAWGLRRFVVRGERSLFVMELPPYRLPRLRDVVWRMIERSRLFLARAGTIILAVSIVLWFLASYPKVEPSAEITRARAAVEQDYAQRSARVGEQGGAAADALAAAADARDAELAALDGRQGAEALAGSAMGRLGHFIEPVIRPLGYDWKIGVALLASFAAREVAVSALGTIYSVQDADEGSSRLMDRLRADVDPVTGRPVFTTLVALSLMIYFVIACQCMSTVAVVKRETNSWRWPIFMLTYLTVLAWLAAFVTFQGGRALGYA